MLFTTLAAPAACAMRVADPLCCMTAVVPSQVTTPCATWNLNPSLPIFDLASLVRMVASISASLGVTDAYNPEQNVWGGTRYLRSMLDRFGGDVTKAIAAYNAGPNAVESHNGVPPYAETQSYVENVLNSYQQYKNTRGTLPPVDTTR